MTRKYLVPCVGFLFAISGCSASSSDTNDSDGGGTNHSAGGAGGTKAGSGGKGGSGGTSVTGGAGGSAGAKGGAGAGGGGGTAAGAGGTGSGGAGTGAADARFIGRFTATHQFAWSGSTIELRFQATDVSVTMGGASEWYDVVVDGTSTEQQISGTASIATGLSNAPHVLQLVRRSEAFNGVAQFMSFSVPQSAVLPQVVPTHRIEVIGDSMAVAYGIDGCGDRVNKDEDAYRSWGYVAARALDADLHIVAMSGIGLSVNLDGSSGTLPTFYDHTLGLNTADQYDLSQYQPDAVVIDLGTNDKNNPNGSGTGYDAAKFKTAYGAFLTTLRSDYPDAFIYCASRNGILPEDIQAAVTTQADAKVKFIATDSKGSNGACDGHMDPTGNQNVADEVVTAIKADLGW